MGSRRGRLTAAVGLVAALAVTSVASAASLRVLMGHTPNMTRSNRTARTIDAIVVHATEGRFVGSVRWLSEARSRGSAHFVVSREGQIVQLVPVTSVAWHSGNSWWNLHSIGIEHEGWTGRGGFTPAEYRASAELVAYLAHRWGIPLDRRHVIGHSEVPNPLRPGSFGGADGHRDPGRHWNWTLYMRLVHRYAAHPVLPTFVHAMTLRDAPLPPVRVIQPLHPAAQGPTSTVVRAAPLRPTALPQPRSVVLAGATLHGSALWWSGIDPSHRWRRHIYRVDFLVDGRLRYTDHTWPFDFHRTIGLNTRALTNGSHLLVLRSYGTHGYRARRTIRVRVRNPLPTLAVSGLAPDGTVAGEVRLGVASNAALRLALYVDGKTVSRDASAPYTLAWDTTAATEGPHTLLVYGRDRYGHRTARTIPVVVANDPTFPAPLAPADLGTQTP